MLHPNSNIKKGQGLTQLTWPQRVFEGLPNPTAPHDTSKSSAGSPAWGPDAASPLGASRG